MDYLNGLTKYFKMWYCYNNQIIDLKHVMAIEKETNLNELRFTMINSTTITFIFSKNTHCNSAFEEINNILNSIKF